MNKLMQNADFQMKVARFRIEFKVTVDQTYVYFLHASTALPNLFYFYTTTLRDKKMANEQDIANFCEITGASTEVAQNYLQVSILNLGECARSFIVVVAVLLLTRTLFIDIR